MILRILSIKVIKFNLTIPISVKALPFTNPSLRIIQIEIPLDKLDFVETSPILIKVKANFNSLLKDILTRTLN